MGAPLLALLKAKAPEQEKQELSAKSYLPISSYHFSDLWIEYVMESSSHTVVLLLYPDGMDVEAEPGSTTLANKVLAYFDRTYRHFCSHRQTPSSGQVGGPAVIKNRRAIYFTNPIFSEYNTVAPRWEKQLFLVEFVLPQLVGHQMIALELC